MMTGLVEGFIFGFRDFRDLGQGFVVRVLGLGFKI